MKTIWTALTKPVNRRISALVLLVLVLNIFDAYATLYILQIDGFYEGNPIQRWFLSLGTNYFLWGKIIIMIVLPLLYLASVAERHPKAAQWGLWTGVFIYSVNALYQVAIIANWLPFGKS